MYFNDIHILIYLIVGLIGCLIGQFIGMTEDRLINHEKIFTKSFFSDIKRKKYPVFYSLMIVMFILYAAILYRFGIQKNFYANIDLISYLFLSPMLVSAFVIDYKEKIIPNRLVLTLFEIGLIFTFLIGVLNPNGISVAIYRLLGMVVGGGIFLIITLIGGLIAGKEAMGFGDVKFMGALGLFFGVKSIIIVSIVSFLLGTVVSLFLIITKIKKPDEYIPFGPFIVGACFISIFVPEAILFKYLWYFFSGEWFLKYFYTK